MKRKIRIGLRLSIAFFAYSFIAIKIGRSGFAEIYKVVGDSFSSENLFLFFIVIILMPVVWALEALKWRLVLMPYTKISFWRSWRSVWYGVVAGHFTPNRVGEPVGRLALIEPAIRGKAGFLAAWCSFTQQIATILFGLIGIIWWIGFKGLPLMPYNFPNWIIYITIILWFLLVVIGLLKIDRLAQWFGHFKWIKSVLHNETLDAKVKISTYFAVQLLSLLRYVVFSTQYVILLYAFGLKIDLISLYAIVSLTYIFTSIIPTFSASEIGVKTGFAIWFAAMISSNPLAVTTASFSLWVLNLAIPAIIAAWFPWRGEE